jgi:hypothetical protein
MEGKYCLDIQTLDGKHIVIEVTPQDMQNIHSSAFAVIKDGAQISGVETETGDCVSVFILEKE